MRKGLITLMTVAIALVSVQAMAMAPVIYDMPSVVVGNQQSVSQPVKYVYIDAFDLNTVVSDDYTSIPLLKWSYNIGGTPKRYTVNGDQMLNLGVDDPVNPAATNPNAVIAGPGAVSNTYTGAAGTTYTGEDTLNNTVTIRNIDLYPYGGSPSTDQSATAQAWNTHAQAVTFFCSDGNLATSSTVLFWTDNHYNNGLPIGVNRLSRGSAWTLKKSDPMTGPGYKPWHTFDPFLDHTTSHTLNGVGICFNVTAAGLNFGSVQSPMPYFTLEQNMVYRIRCTMNSSQSTPGKTPFWDFILENWTGDPATGLNLYGMDSFYVDNEGGANTILQTGAGTEMTMIWAPAAFQTNQWNSTTTGLYSIDTSVTPNVPRYAGRKDPCLRFRVLDLDNNAPLKNDLKSGDICLTKCIVEACNYSRCSVETGGNVVQIGGLKTVPVTPSWPDGTKADAPKNASNTVPGGNMIITQLTGATWVYTAATNTTATTPHVYTPGYVTITPTTAVSQQAELVEITPATDRNYTFPSNDILDNWPVPWQSNKIYRLAVDLNAPTTNDAASPWDVMWLSMEPPTNEMVTESFVTAKDGFAMPKTGTPQTYMMFYWSGHETVSSVSQLHNLRWRVRIANSAALNWPAPSNTVNTGSVRLHKVTVDKVQFQ